VKALWKQGFLLLFYVALLMQSCEQTPDKSDNRLTILTTIPPLYSFAKNIAGDIANVENLLPNGAEPHDYSFGPSDIKKVSKAQIIIKNGLSLETWLDKLLASAEENSAAIGRELFVVDSSSGIDVIDNDPHIWLSPKRAVVQVKNIRDALIRLDTVNAEVYSRNAALYINRLQTLSNDITFTVGTFKRREFVAFHSAFKYFADDYGLDQAAVIQESPGITSSPTGIAEVIDIIRERDIKAIFSEPGSSHKIVNSIADDLGLEVHALDTLETGSLSKDWYENKMRANLEVLRTALNK
jgi:zinc transport system substrate-binding protein